MQLIEGVSLVQFEFFAVAAVLSAILFSAGFMLGRVSKGNKAVKVPMEVLHALATTRFDATPRFDAHGHKDSKGDLIVHAVEGVLEHVEHEHDFKKAQEHALHEIEKIEHDHGATPALKDLHSKIEHAHSKEDIEHALHDFIEHH